MSNILLIDFGASRIKSVVVNTGINEVIGSYEVVSPSSCYPMVDNKFEIPADLYWAAFEVSVDTLINKHGPVSKIFICSEMHGFVLSDNDTPVTGYISWKDQRVDISNVHFSPLQFFNLTGMKLRSGLPFVTLSGIENKFENPLKFNTIVDWILLRGGCRHPLSNLTLAAGSGLVDINGNWNEELINSVNVKLTFNRISSNVKDCLGTVNISGHLIPVYAGIGDLQSALFGAGFDTTVDAVLNLGTGSQVITKYQQGTETRPGVSGDLLSVITHIPSGRALNIIANFVNSISNTDVFWDRWKKINPQSIVDKQPRSDLNFFDSAWKWNGAGYISLSEQNFSFDDVLSEIARAWVQQYIDALNELDSDKQYTTVGVIGGLASKSPFIIPVLNQLDSPRSYQYVSSITGEETLDGLLKVSKL